MKPDFLCIGAQKAGTTWLYRALRQHPRVAMPPIKELHYFDRNRRPYVRDLFSRHPPTRRRFLRWLRDGVRAARDGRAELLWCVRFFAMPRSDAWYTALFGRPDGMLSGDITPGYARLGRDAVAYVHRLLPDVRIVYLLRDPIDRAWSQAAMYFRQYHGSASIDAVDPAVVRAFVVDPYNLRNGEYCRTLDVWRERYPPERILLLSYDDLERDAVASLRRVHAFLDIDGAVPDDVRVRVYTSPYPRIPADLAAALAAHFQPSLRQLAEQHRVASAARWLERAEALLSAAGR